MESDPSPTPQDRARHALSGLVVAVFRLNGDLLAAGDLLVQDLGLTSARWQVLGAIALAPAPLPVAHIARNMGLARQSVQRVVDDMRADGLVRLEPNPHHRRAPLVAMTPRGADAYRQAMARNDLWSDGLTEGLAPEAIEAAGTLLQALQQRIGASHGAIASIAATSGQETRHETRQETHG
ncbi:MarR family transcriptional regulator [Methylobacterium sp. P1-11]|uniref:MarR family winged helix-turn-helix transcriptional regulator n=1 Tax=Methylobacterium sp. P1-11 TaxID=2024616 RepID=UPI0011F00134|nr:helix-turn-helix domain-containing protein [Methylobacterium sp. P1-11]KAA0120954.1 MarR family transcriptional regulator [Methylobacterium sp. P1-11]